MTIKRTIDGKTVEIELTGAERYKAYLEEQYDLCREDVREWATWAAEDGDIDPELLSDDEWMRTLLLTYLGERDSNGDHDSFERALDMCN